MEIEISCAEANEKHGVICKHGRMDNGELRFRLQKNDGTAYIRTESPPEGGWQRSHYHKKVKETYIVQEGWIGYAELKNGKPRLVIYQQGESFTTEPEKVHNIYMPAGAIIHTVKHGDSTNEKRLEDDRTTSFTALTRGISEEDLRRCAASLTPDQRTIEPNVGYSDAYFHFDNLIWQIPAWSSAIFAVVLAGTSGLNGNDIVVAKIGLSPERLLSFFYGLIGFFILVLSHSLYRFRWHQIRAKDYTPQTHLFSPQVSLQLIVNLQAIVLFVLSSLLEGLAFENATGTFVLFLVILTVYQENKLIQQGRAENRPIETRS